jgi:hypothetical protein
VGGSFGEDDVIIVAEGAGAGVDGGAVAVSPPSKGGAAFWGVSAARVSALSRSPSGAAIGEGASSPEELVATAGGTDSSTGGVSAASVVWGSAVVAGSSACMIAPPAPNSTMLIAHSLHATRWRQGRRTTSRGELRQTRHSDDGSSSAGAGTIGGYVCTAWLSAGTVAWTEVEERPKISCKWNVCGPI